MNRQEEIDIRTLYQNTLNSNLVDCLIIHLDTFQEIDSNLSIKTQESDAPMKHFSVFHNSLSNRVVFAGAPSVKNADQMPVPIIRFSNPNVVLKSIHPRFMFPYIKEQEEWTNVEVRQETIDSMPALFVSQLQWYVDRYINKQQK